MSTPSLRVAEYCETLDALNKARAETSLTPPVEDLLMDKLDDLWVELTVSEVREIKLARIA